MQQFLTLYVINEKSFDPIECIRVLIHYSVQEKEFDPVKRDAVFNSLLDLRKSTRVSKINGKF